MDFIKIIFTSFGSIVALFIITKVMGDRQLSELSMFDYVVGITIGSIAAEMATSLEDDYRKPLVAMIVYGLVSVCISFFTCKSITFRRFMEGKALILYQNGNLNQKNLLKAKIDVDEFLTLCRQGGFFTLDDIHTAILEPNGKVSFLPVSSKRPVNPSDLNLTPAQEWPAANVVIDGHILTGNLRSTGNDEKWLHHQLHAHGVKDISDVILATCDPENNFCVYVKQGKPMTKDIFQ